MGQERIANELLVKLGLQVSPRTVRKYLPKRPTQCPRGDQLWSTFLKNHAQAIVACDLFVCVTSTFQLLYVLVVMEHHSRRLIHCNVTAHPTAAWTRQQLREALGFDPAYQYLIHDRDSIFSAEVDASIGSAPASCPEIVDCSLQSRSPAHGARTGRAGSSSCIEANAKVSS